MCVCKRPFEHLVSRLVPDLITVRQMVLRVVFITKRTALALFVVRFKAVVHFCTVAQLISAHATRITVMSSVLLCDRGGPK